MFGDLANPPIAPADFADLDYYSLLPPETNTTFCPSDLANYPCISPNGGNALFTSNNDGFWITSLIVRNSLSGQTLEVWDGDTGVVGQKLVLDPTQGWQQFDFLFLTPTGNAVLDPQPYGMQNGVNLQQITFCRDDNQRAPAAATKKSRFKARRALAPKRGGVRVEETEREEVTPWTAALRFLGLAA